MAKNFDYILQLAEYVPGFKKLHAYCTSLYVTETFENSSNILVYRSKIRK